MAMPDPTPTTIEFGVNFPCEEDLETGDVLFARLPAPHALMQLSSLQGRFLDIRVGDYIGAQRVFQVAVVAGLDDIAVAAYSQWTSDDLTLEAFSMLPSKDEVALVLAILYTEFRGLLLAWFGLTLQQFLFSPLVQLLLKIFRGKLQDSFFIGHCALVICEPDLSEPSGRKVYVIEANTTSFDQYGVSMHPYTAKDDGSIGSERFRSWAAFRASRGNWVWSARPNAISDADNQTAANARFEIARVAKLFLGRPYGFFDSASYGDTGRLYCGEYVYATFLDVLRGSSTGSPQKSIQPLGEDVRTWKWMRENNPPKTSGDLGHIIEDCFNDPVIGKFIVKNQLFFILTVQMLYRSGYLKPEFLAGGEVYQ